MLSDDIERIRVEPAAEDVPSADGSAPVFAAAAGDLADAYTPFLKIGEGGMGTVFLARDRRLGRFVAIKRLAESARADVLLRKRFLQEAHAVAGLNHIHIVHIYALGEDAEGPYMVMEYVAGPAAAPGQDPEMPNPPLTLDRLVRDRGPRPFAEALDLMLKIAGAVAYAHA